MSIKFAFLFLFLSFPALALNQYHYYFEVFDLFEILTRGENFRMTSNVNDRILYRISRKSHFVDFISGEKSSHNTEAMNPELFKKIQDKCKVVFSKLNLDFKDLKIILGDFHGLEIQDYYFGPVLVPGKEKPIFLLLLPKYLMNSSLEILPSWFQFKRRIAKTFFAIEYFNYNQYYSTSILKYFDDFLEKYQGLIFDESVDRVFDDVELLPYSKFLLNTRNPESNEVNSHPVDLLILYRKIFHHFLQNYHLKTWSHSNYLKMDIKELANEIQSIKLLNPDETMKNFIEEAKNIQKYGKMSQVVDYGFYFGLASLLSMAIILNYPNFSSEVDSDDPTESDLE